MKKKLLAFVLVVLMAFGLISGIALKALAQGGAGEKVVNFRRKSDGTEIPGGENTSFKNANAMTDRNGYVNGRYGADAAYLGEEDGKVKFMISGVVGLVEKEKVQICGLKGFNVTYYKVTGRKLLHYVTGQNADNALHPLMAGFAPSYLSEGATYYSYDGHYFYEDYSAMLKDYRAETRANSVNPDKPYYNYYQYLPLRTKTVYTRDELTAILDSKVKNNSKLKGLGGCFVECQDKYGVNALIMAGIAANESAWGTSEIALTKNNLFGIRAYDSNPFAAKDFISTAQCVEEFAKECMSKGYADPDDWRYNGMFLGDKASGINVRYASDPYWGEKAANIAWELDTAGLVDKKDRYTYKIGIKDVINNSGTVDLNVRKESNTGSPVIYTTKALPHYPFVILGEENGFYKVQSDPPLLKDRSDVADVDVETGTGEYDFETMYLYVSKDYITLINSEAPQEPEPQEPGTQEPEPQEPGTQEPGTQEPGSQEPGTQEPGTQEPGTQEPGTQEPGSQEPEPPQGKAKGDVNGDGNVNIIDARWLLQASTGSRKLTDEQKAVSDVNNDGKINIIDARWLLQVSTGSRKL